MSIWALVVSALVTMQSQQTEPKPVPKDSVEIVTAGCLKGRVFAAIGPREEGAGRGPDVGGRSFRLAGPKPVMEEVKKQNGHYVEVAGIVLKSALMNQGVRVGGVVIGGQAPSSDPVGSMRSPMGGLPVMDATAVRFLDASCPLTSK
jgi:hypothetical protein